MASACVNNIGVSPESFIDCPPAAFPSYEWLSPRISFSREFPDEDSSKGSRNRSSSKKPTMARNEDEEKLEEPDLEISSKDFVDFEFRLEDPVAMLPADELFADGKLVPLQLSSVRHSMTSAPMYSDVRSPDTPHYRRKNEISSRDPYLFSPKAPRCSSRWRELLGLKKLYQNSNAKQEDSRTPSSLSSNNHSKPSSRGLKHLLQRSSKSSLNTSLDSSLNLPLLKDSDSESLSLSSRLSLSSSSSGHDHDDLPRLSLDSDKPSSITRNTHQSISNLSRVRLSKYKAVAVSSENRSAPCRAGRSPMRKAPDTTAPVRGVSVDSPRMNSSGKIVFHSLERSSSSPSTFNGGPRHKHRGMERSYSANVRITPVLNVPVCSLRGSSKSGVFGFPLFATQQRKDNGVGGSTAGNRSQHSHNRNRTDRT